MSSGVAGGGGSEVGLVSNERSVVMDVEASGVPLAGPPKGSIEGLLIEWAQGHGELFLDFCIVVL